MATRTWAAVVFAGVCVTVNAKAPQLDRPSVLSRAQVWRPMATPTLDLRTGPDGRGALPPGAAVSCRYKPHPLSGNSPKFWCEVGPGEVVKVKFGGSNGEVYAEIAASRLLWALGFGSDREYPVRVACSGCPDWVEGIDRRADHTRIVFPATIERDFLARKAQGLRDTEWGWDDLDDARAAPKAQRDALKLLAVFIQHTDNKREQQRIVCLDPKGQKGCEQPFLVVHDLGLTFGEATRSNSNDASSANLEAWSHTPVWKGSSGCVGNLARSLTGTLDHPVISEEGRAFLAARLSALSDAQLRDLFSVARFDLRPRDPRKPGSGRSTIDEWVAAFEHKRQEIADRRCPPSAATSTAEASAP